MSEQMRRMVPKQFYELHQQSSQITFKTSFGNCVLKALQNRQWKQIEGAGWNLQWSQKERVNDMFEEGPSSHQRINHFRLWYQLCRKDMMIKNIKRHKRHLQKLKLYVEKQWDFLPLTFFLPSQYIMFAEEFKKKGGLWIMKPTSKCQGQGIFIVDKLSQVAPFRQKAVIANTQPSPFQQKNLSKNKKQQKVQQEGTDSEEQIDDEVKEQEAQTSQSYLIQQYISRPLLFGCKKFDLRIYCLCTNYSSLTAWLYRSGFARFTHEPYNTDNIDNLESHLTNVEIQKHSENYDERRGGKWLIDKLKHYLFSRYDSAKVDFCFTEIKNIILRSLQSVQKSILPSKNSFELYGYDFMIDESLKPWLIEINGGPSMTANTDFDCRLKCGLIDDVLSVLDLEGILQGNQMAVGGFDLIIDKGVRVVQEKHFTYQSTLGFKNQRQKVMNSIVKKFLMAKKNKKEEEEKEKELKENKKKIAVKNDENKKEKLLPNFYYKKKWQEVHSEARQLLQEELRLIARNENLKEHESGKFVPIGSN